MSNKMHSAPLTKHIGHTLSCRELIDDTTNVADGVAIYCHVCREQVLVCDDDAGCYDSSVWMLTVLHETGSDFYIFDDETTARAQLYQHVLSVWDDEFPGEPIPKEPRRAIYEYFADNESSSFTLIEQPILYGVEV